MLVRFRANCVLLSWFSGEFDAIPAPDARIGRRQPEHDSAPSETGETCDERCQRLVPDVVKGAAPRPWLKRKQRDPDHSMRVTRLIQECVPHLRFDKDRLAGVQNELRRIIPECATSWIGIAAATPRRSALQAHPSS